MKKLLSIAIGACLVAGTATAGEYMNKDAKNLTQTKATDVFVFLDADNNDWLTRKEVAEIKALRGSFADLDTNNDERLTQDEFIAVLEEDDSDLSIALYDQYLVMTEDDTIQREPADAPEPYEDNTENLDPDTDPDRFIEATQDELEDSGRS